MTIFKRNELSKGIKVAVMASMLVYLPLKSEESHAVPVIDTAAIAQIVSQTSQQAANFAKEMAAYAKQMAQDIMLAGQKMRNDMNRSLMEVGNITDVQTQTHN